ncbi:hypothetical protein AYO21_06735 [Fonsecaea monophora]|uniref:DUF7924 domain-containing protein n=1 Tax=Fonsecaea monophora TaxID=254056 RepID=A0A177F3X7_9EURO|nr:hypothetical protein AYO21_06735 [Fonsecaea monophora]OAG39015.1 hypothetical protein AYO21_06735 [Fonsecaea monophora]
MATGVTERNSARDVGAAKKGRDKRGRYQAKPDRSRLTRDEDDNKDTTECSQTTRKTRYNSNPHRQRNPNARGKPYRTSPRSQKPQIVNQSRTARGGQTNSSAAEHHYYPEENPHQFTPQSTGIKRKRSHESQADAEVKVYNAQDEHVTKQPRKSPPPLLELPEDLPKNITQFRSLGPSKDQLSEHNLRLFNGEMNLSANNSPVLKRTSSRRSLAASSDIDTVRSQRSSNTTAFYRYKHLEVADIYIHTDLPGDIEADIDRIVKAKVSKHRSVKLSNIAKGFYGACKEAVKAAAGEDDFVHIFRRALEAMSPDEIMLREKADWREELKPIPQQSDLNLSFLVNVNAVSNDQQDEVDDASAPPPPKRQQQSGGQMCSSPQSSMVDALNPSRDNRQLEPAVMPPPINCSLMEKPKETFPIKTPRPDITVGIKEESLISALSILTPQDLNKTEAKRFLNMLEDTMIPSKRGGSMEPLLIAVPTQRKSDLVFPFAVVEGKAYSTGKQVFEAQNQAAVSGACGLKMQLCLNELVKRSTSDFALPSSTIQPPLFFSICTEGPYHELWAHYTHLEDGVQKFKMKLLKICNGVLLDGVEDFIVAVDNVLRWGTGQFLKSVVERLGKVVNKAKSQNDS